MSSRQALKTSLLPLTADCDLINILWRLESLTRSARVSECPAAEFWVHFLSGGNQWLALQANAEKLRLEQKQRAARKAAEEGAPLEPRWFARIPGAQSGESLTYRYKGGYFEARAQGHFEGCRDIFSDNPVTLDGKSVEVPPVSLNKPKSS